MQRKRLITNSFTKIFTAPTTLFLRLLATLISSMLEPALASGVAIVSTLALLGLAAPVALIFALAFSPIAWGLACAGAWVGRPAR